MLDTMERTFMVTEGTRGFLEAGETHGERIIPCPFSYRSCLEIASLIRAELGSHTLSSEDQAITEYALENVYLILFYIVIAENTDHPSESKLIACAGDKQGYVGLWDVNSHAPEE